MKEGDLERRKPLKNHRRRDRLKLTLKEKGQSKKGNTENAIGYKHGEQGKSAINLECSHWEETKKKKKKKKRRNIYQRRVVVMNGWRNG